MNKSIERAGNLIFIALIICVVIVFAVRIFGNTGWDKPMFILTSGFEEESLYAIWKHINRQDIYRDHHKFPFAASYFNWLFYIFYGTLIKIVTFLTNLDDARIPLVGRYISVLGCIGGALISAASIKKITNTNKITILIWSVLISLFFGYLMGFWAFTVRPDVWAMTLEVLGLYFFICYIKDQKVSLLILSAIVFYMAWSFKHSFMGVAAGCGIWLLLDKRIGHAFTFGIIAVGLVIATYFLGSDDYRFLLVKSQLKMGLVPRIGWHNFQQAMMKCMPVGVFGSFLLIYTLVRFGIKKVTRQLQHDKILSLLLITGISSFILFAVAAMKAGASDNYFFSPFAVLAILIAYVLHKISSKENIKIIYFAYSLICLLTIAEGILILKGKFGVTDLSAMSAKYHTIKKYNDQYKTPLYVEKDNNANLPWINPSKQNFIIATTYYQKGYADTTKFEFDGIEGLMDQGYFETIINIDKVRDNNKGMYSLTDTIFDNSLTLYVWKKNL